MPTVDSPIPRTSASVDFQISSTGTISEIWPLRGGVPIANLPSREAGQLDHRLDAPDVSAAIERARKVC
jgi:hypothetical protein